LRGLARSVLERRGYQVLEASSGVRALEVWRAHCDQIHLVLTDMILPEGLSGRELVQTLRQQKADLPVVYTSGYSAGVDGNDFAGQQRMVFLQKPYSPTTLAGAVRSALDS
jgi:CheY-like chemotaxis protein